MPHIRILDEQLISQIAADKTFSTGNECIAVSETSDATGKYNRYIFKFGSKVFNDYDKLSVRTPIMPTTICSARSHSSVTTPAPMTAPPC